MIQSIKLKTSSILQVPIDKYPNNFSFIVNGKEYQTSFIIADLLSPKIAKIHLSDPTMNKYFINTQTKGDFQNFLNLQNFEEKSLNESDIPFYNELIKEFGIESFDFKMETVKLTIDNIFEQLNLHSRSKFFYSDQYKKEVEFVSSNFSDIVKKYRKDVKKQGVEFFEEVLSNEKFQIESEDDLVEFINEVYAEDAGYSNLYGFVYFTNVSVKTITDFLRIFDIEDMNAQTWRSISNRLRREISDKKKEQETRYKTTNKKTNEKDKNDQEKKEFMKILYSNKEFEGILNFFGSNIENEIKPTSSSNIDGNPSYVIKTNASYLGTKDESNSWICFEFLKRQIIPTHYTIKSNYNHPRHLRSWVVEGSLDGVNWTKIDEQNNCSFLNGYNYVHTFTISNKEEQEFKYIRIRQTGKNWNNTNGLYLCRVEFYGQISQ